MTVLIIARHGNTFGPNQTPTRVGGRTDLPLVESGIEQAIKIGAWLKQQEIYPEVTYCSSLKRTQETAQKALIELGYNQPVFPLKIFDEIDYGPDENKTEDVVIKRIGEQAIKDWDEKAIVPQGWKFNPDDCIQNWKDFAAQHASNPITPPKDLAPEGTLNKVPEDILDAAQANQNTEEVVMVVTSNGIARFAPHLAGDFDEFANNNKIKLSTGALGILKYEGTQWTVTDWNIKP